MRYIRGAVCTIFAFSCILLLWMIIHEGMKPDIEDNPTAVESTAGTKEAEMEEEAFPQFVIKKRPVCYTGTKPDLKKYISVSDKTDGDLTDKVKVTSGKLKTDEAGLYPVTLEVTNSLGNTASYNMFMNVVEKSESKAAIKLKKYSITLNKNAEFDPEDYVDSVLDEDGKEVDAPELDIINEGSTKNSGVYPVIYQGTDHGKELIAVLMVEIR